MYYITTPCLYKNSMNSVTSYPPPPQPSLLLFLSTFLSIHHLPLPLLCDKGKNAKKQIIAHGQREGNRKRERERERERETERQRERERRERERDRERERNGETSLPFHSPFLFPSPFNLLQKNVTSQPRKKKPHLFFLLQLCIIQQHWATVLPEVFQLCTVLEVAMEFNEKKHDKMHAGLKIERTAKFKSMAGAPSQDKKSWAARAEPNPSTLRHPHPYLCRWFIR